MVGPSIHYTMNAIARASRQIVLTLIVTLKMFSHYTCTVTGWSCVHVYIKAYNTVLVHETLFSWYIVECVLNMLSVYFLLTHRHHFNA